MRDNDLFQLALGITSPWFVASSVFDAAKKWTCHAASSHSKSKNSPFDGWQLQGKVVATVVGGNIVFREK